MFRRLVTGTALLALVTMVTACSRDTADRSSGDGAVDMKALAEANMAIAAAQYNRMLESLSPSDGFPRTLRPDGTVRTVRPPDWTCGFFPGCLWLLYEHTDGEDWRWHAEGFTDRLKQQRLRRSSHEIGFVMYTSYGNGLRLTGDEAYSAILLDAAESLFSRFNPAVGCIRSYDEGPWSYPVLIDNMMNLELLFWAAREAGISEYADAAISHADVTSESHFRSDGSCYQVVDYDESTGEILARRTREGHSDESAWARGQAWGLYGFTVAYRETGHRRYLDRARQIADYVLANPNLPESMIPPWDLDIPGPVTAPRDASAAAVLCSALYELGPLVGAEGDAYIDAADRILVSLSSPQYRSDVGENGGFLLRGSVVRFSRSEEMVAPLIFADYYFLEANLRRLRLSEE